MLSIRHSHPAGFVPWFLGDGAQAPAADGLSVAWEAGLAVAHLPFDAMRSQHAVAAQAGLIQKSLLESSQFEHAMDALERLTLGPLARRV
jgi:hypothetical protein